MKSEFFVAQMNRLKDRFGDKAMNKSFADLVWREVYDMSEVAFAKACDVWIGNRPHTKPPLLAEFREARMNEQKHKFQDDVRGASYFLSRKSPEETRRHLKLILSKDFGGVDSVSEALEVAKHKQRIAKANNDDGGAA